MVIRSGGALSGRTTRGGCGSNVIAIGVAAALGGAALHALENLQVAAMHAVEVAERQHRVRPPRRRADRRENEMTSIVRLELECTRPSYASSMPSGSARRSPRAPGRGRCA